MGVLLTADAAARSLAPTCQRRLRVYWGNGGVFPLLGRPEDVVEADQAQVDERGGLVLYGSRALCDTSESLTTVLVWGLGSTWSVCTGLGEIAFVLVCARGPRGEGERGGGGGADQGGSA